MGDQTWVNWGRNQRAWGVDVRRPATPAEVAAVVAEAAAAGRRIRPAGSGHSFTDVARPDDIQMLFDRMTGALNVDRAAGLVTVRAGTTLAALNALLDAEGLALDNLGDVDGQTVAGAIATGTHGTGAGRGGLATQVRALELVLADGSVRVCSPTSHPELFAAARVGLGALGIVTAVTLQAVPAFALRADERRMRLDDILDGFGELLEEPDHAEFFWFPHTPWALLKRNTRVRLSDGLAPLGRARAWFGDEFLANTVFGGVVAAGRRAPGMVAPLNRACARALGTRTFTDVSHRVFVSPRRVRFVEMEYAVPRADLPAVFREVAGAIERSGLRVSFPVESRLAAADEIPLSTAYGRDSGYVAVHMEYRGCYQAYFELVERILAGAGGRPHWGKLHTLTATDLRSRYPLFDEFVAIRDSVDPAGLFANGYLDRVLGPAPRPTVGVVPARPEAPDGIPGPVGRALRGR